MKVIHQPALLNRQYLVECTGDVESHGVLVLYLQSLVVNLLFRHPALVAESELKLVAILLCLYRTEDRHELRQFYLANTLQLVVNLLLLGLQLLFVWQVLPLASAADTKMLAHGHLSHLAKFNKAYHLSLAIAMAFLSYL